MENFIGVLLIICLAVWALSGAFKGIKDEDLVGERSHLLRYERKARVSTSLYRFVISVSLLLGIGGSLLIGWYFTSLTGNYDFIFYAVGISLGLVVTYTLVKSVINTSENTYVSTLLKSDLIEATNKNSALLEALLVNTEKKYATEALNEIEVAGPGENPAGETFENTTDNEK